MEEVHLPSLPSEIDEGTTEPKGSKRAVEPVEELDFAEDPAEATWLAYKFTHLKLEIPLHLGEESNRKVDSRSLHRVILGLR